MNLLRQEWRAGRKAFLLWGIGIALLVWAGITKYEGIVAAGESDIQSFLTAFPRVVLAVFGMVDVDVNSLPGYFTIIGFLAQICFAVYALRLGHDAVARETVDRTDEFLFSRPRTRRRILTLKLVAAFAFLLVLTLVFILVSMAATASLAKGTDLPGTDGLDRLIVLSGIAVFLTATVYLALGAVLAAYLRRAEQAMLIANLVFLATFILSVIADVLENASLIRPWTPFKFFPGPLLVSGELQSGYAAWAVLLTAAGLGLALWRFDRRDLTCR